MPIVLSEVSVVGAAQIDGRRYVIERHTDNLGVVHEVEYLADGGADYEAIKVIHAGQLNANLAEEEFNSITG